MLTHNQRITVLVIALAGLLLGIVGLRLRIVLPTPIDRALPYPDQAEQQFGEDVASSGLSKDITSSIIPVPPGGTASLDDVTREDRLIVRSGNLSVVVSDVSETVGELNVLATNLGGFVVSSTIDATIGLNEDGQQESTSGARLGSVVLRVPVERFSEALEHARDLGRVVDESTTGQDVTEEFVDTEARLKNLRASEEQFLDIMKRASKIEDVLQVQQQLERVRGEIEQTQGRMQYLERSAKLATVEVNLSTDEEELPIIDPADRWRPGVIIKEAFRSLLSLFQSLGTILLWIVIFIPVWVPIGLLLWWLRRRQSSAVKKF